MLRIFSIAGIFLMVCIAAHGQESSRWVHPACKALEISKSGPFVQLDDGTLLVVDKNVLRRSSDGGKTWSDPGQFIYSGVNMGSAGHVGQFLRTKNGALVIVYLDFDNYKWSWNNETGGPNPESRLELWSIRSLDDGKTWTDRQLLVGGYNADFMGFVQTSKGALVATVEHLVPELKRWVALSLYSEDDGLTWRQSNWLDLGGHGHHDGALEPMVTELQDGRLMMLLRTNLDQFWRAYSDDGGKYWRTLEPTGISASSAPGWLLRLNSGHLALVYNQRDPEGKGPWPKTMSAGPAAEFPTSWYREELSMTFSEDQGKTWTKPVVIAREPGSQLAYPYLFEKSPGVLWAFTRYNKGGSAEHGLAVEIKEEDLVNSAAR